MNCTECPLKRLASKADGKMTIRRQESFGSPLKFVLDRPEPHFVRSELYNSYTVEIFQRFIKTEGDIVFTKNCVQARDVKGIAEDRKARQHCSGTFQSDLAGAKVIVACGDIALEALGYSGRKVSQSTGWVDYNEELGASVLCCVDPHKAEENPGIFWKDFIWTVQRAEAILLGEAPDRNILPPVEYTTVSDFETFKAITEGIADGEYVECDLETGGLNSLDPDQEILMKGLHHEGTCGALIVTPELMASPEYRRYCHEVFFPRIKLVLHNSKFDTKFIERKLEIDTPVALDTLVLHHFIDERTGTHSLERLVRVYLNWAEYWLELGQHVTNKNLGYREVPFDVLAKYLAYDLVGTCELRKLFLSKLRDDTDKDLPWPVLLSQREHYECIMVPVNNELRIVEREGTEVDVEVLDHLIEVTEPVLEERRRAIEEEFFNETGLEISVDSPIQLLEGLQAAKILPMSAESTDRKILKEYADKFPLVKDILEYKQIFKDYSTYYMGSRKRLDEEAMGQHKLFPRFSLVGTICSRWSSAGPNFQQVPRDGPFKGIFIPSPGRIMFQIDFKGLEARIAAWLAQDEVLARACEADLHQTVADKAFPQFLSDLELVAQADYPELLKFADSHPMLLPTVKTINELMEKGKPFEDGVSRMRKHLRTCAKAITFGIFFGRGAMALARDELQCSVGEAEQFIKEYFNLFPKLHKWILAVHKIVREEGVIIGPDGRIRDLRYWRFSPQLMERKKQYARACRQAVNFLTQGTAGTVNNIAFHKSARYLRETGVGRVKGAVHDSIVGELDDNDETRYHLKQLRDIGENALVVDLITFKQDCEVGPSWGKVVSEDEYYGINN